MVFIKVVKNKAYFKRFQVQFRRRREGVTDYRQRQRLITQDKSKFNAPKYRIVIRRTNKDFVCQIVSAKLVGDQVMCAAYAHELPKYGLKVGLTNYASAYCTGLLCARRLLQKLGLDTKYVGATEVDGNKFLVEHKGRARPFKAFVDIGLQRTTTGARIFGAIKGACDGGLYIPHSNNRFPGFKKANEEFDAKIHRDRIYGVHVANYMKHLQKSDEAAYKKQFSQYIKEGIKPEAVEALYKKVHAAIRANPVAVKKVPKGTTKKFNTPRLDLVTRQQRVAVKKAKLMAKRTELEKERTTRRKAHKKEEKEEEEEKPAEVKDAKAGDKKDAKAGDKKDAKAGDKKDDKKDAKAGDKKPDAKKK